MDIDLRGPMGNAFAVGGIAIGAARQLGHTEEQITEMVGRFTSGNYANILNTIDLELPYVFRFIGDPRTKSDFRALAKARSRRDVQRRPNPKVEAEPATLPLERPPSRRR